MAKDFAVNFFPDTFLTVSEASELSQLFQCQTFVKDTTVFSDEDAPAAFYIVKSGKVELLRNDSGRVRLVDLLVQGDFFGEMALLEGKGWIATAVAKEDSQLYFITRESFERLTRSHPALASKILVFISEKLDSPFRMEAFEFNEDRYALNRTIVFSSPVGGCGRTFVATNVASSLAEHYGSDRERAVGVLDLDFPFGIAHLYYGVDRGKGWGRYLLDIERTGESPSIADYTTPCGKGVSLLSAPDEEFVHDFQKGDVYHLVKAMGESFGIVVVIAPSGLCELSQAALDCADISLIVSPYTIDALARLKTFCRMIRKRPGYPDSFPVILNRTGSSCDVRASERDVIPTAVIGRVQNSSLPSKSLREGELLVRSHPKSHLSRSIADIVQQVTGRDCSQLSSHTAWLSEWFPFAGKRTYLAESGFPAEMNSEISPEFFRRKRGKSRLALGEALFIDGQYFRAFQELRRAVEDDPHLARAYSLLGEIALSLGRKREALDYFGLCLRYDSNDFRGVAFFPILKDDRALMEKAAIRLEEAIKIHPDWADLYMYLGFVQLNLQAVDDGRKNFEQALSFNEKYSMAHYGLALSFEKENSFVRAIEYYLQAVLYNPGNLRALMGLAILYRSLNLTEQLGSSQ